MTLYRLTYICTLTVQTVQMLVNCCHQVNIKNLKLVSPLHNVDKSNVLAPEYIKQPKTKLCSKVTWSSNEGKVRWKPLHLWSIPDVLLNAPVHHVQVHDHVDHHVQPHHHFYHYHALVDRCPRVIQDLQSGPMVLSEVCHVTVSLRRVLGGRVGLLLCGLPVDLRCGPPVHVVRDSRVLVPRQDDLVVLLCGLPVDLRCGPPVHVVRASHVLVPRQYDLVVLLCGLPVDLRCGLPVHVVRASRVLVPRQDDLVVLLCGLPVDLRCCSPVCDVSVPWRLHPRSAGPRLHHLGSEPLGFWELKDHSFPHLDFWDLSLSSAVWAWAAFGPSISFLLFTL